MTDTEKAAMDAMTYEDMLRVWRFAPAGDRRFQGERGRYFADRMAQMRAAEADNGVGVSKKLGWGWSARTWYIDIAAGHGRLRYHEGAVSVSPPETSAETIEAEVADYIEYHRLLARRGETWLRVWRATAP